MRINRTEVAVVFLPARGLAHSFCEAHGQEKWIMGTFLELNHNFLLKDLNLSRCFYKVSK